MNTYLFYDVETSGLNPAFDQILTFASIRYDQKFNEIKRNSIVIQLRPDIVPSPRAFIVHRLDYNDLKAGLVEYEAAVKIHKILNKPGTISLGYNTLRFDDEFLRFLFYRNLLDPYTHQYSRGNSRMDILPLLTLYYIFDPSIIDWPRHDNGKPSFKLEKIGEQNSLVVSGRAHEAMADVEATYSIARKLKSKPEIFNYAVDFFNKQKDASRITRFKTSFPAGDYSFKLGIIVSHQFGFDNNYLSFAIDMGESEKYSNQSLWLRLDRENISDFVLNPENSMALLIRKRYGDIPIILPAIDRFYRRLPAKNIKLAEKNLKFIGGHESDFFKIIDFHRQFTYPYIPDIDPDAALYQAGFFKKNEKQEIFEFHEARLEDKIAATEQIKSNRVRTLARRIISRNYPHILIKQHKSDHCDRFNSSEFREMVNKIRLSGHGGVIKGFRDDTKLNCKNALKELDETLKLDLDNEQKKILDWLKDYIKGIGT